MVGAEVFQGLTPLEHRAVTAVLGGAPSLSKALEQAGDSDPNAHVSRVFNRPRVQSALNAALEAAGATPTAVAKVYTRNLDARNPAIQLRAADSVARIMGELNNFSDDKDKNASQPTTLIVMNFNPNVQAPDVTSSRVSGIDSSVAA